MRFIRTFLALGLATAIGACSSGSSPQRAADGASGSKPTSVTIKTFAYQPSPLTISSGTTVLWTNEDEILHTVTSGTPGADGSVPDSEGEEFAGTLAEQGETFEFRFDSPGTYKYFCERHPTAMTAEVIVE